MKKTILSILISLAGLVSMNAEIVIPKNLDCYSLYGNTKANMEVVMQSLHSTEASLNELLQSEILSAKSISKLKAAKADLEVLKVMANSGEACMTLFPKFKEAYLSKMLGIAQTMNECLPDVLDSVHSEL